ncbi:MAG: hypothetical protein HYR72_01060 [Deltaproteobacteria bacterium]|nr:hypothetical protein [Deltaproteobacteria bacterium]MBI3391331.1 hypothetical protein [Deltaproteobacteria bacterium]
MIIEAVTDWLAGTTPEMWFDNALRVLRLWGPIVTLPGLAGPVGALGGLLALVILTGVALASLASFVVAVLALYLVLSEIFGFQLELAVA